MAKKTNQEPPLSYSELCLFADEHKLRVEIEKPFSEFSNLFLLVTKDGEIVKRITLNDISYLEEESAKLLSELIKHDRFFKT